MLQPIIVRTLSNGQYQIIAGERRWRAAQLAGLSTIRATCREFDDKNALMISLLENLQRENLDPIEEASGYHKMFTDWKMKHEEIAEAVGKDRTTISNTLRLLDLPVSIQAQIIARKLTPGHARALLALENLDKQQTLAERIVAEGLSVRQTEKIVYGNATEQIDRVNTKNSQPAHLADLERRVSERLGVKSLIQQGRRGGKLVIKFSSNAEFLHILDVLGVTD
jgi:ParB family chromosome partitioning protein